MVASLERQEGGLTWKLFRSSDEFEAPRPEESSTPRLLVQVREGDEWRTHASFEIASACSMIALRGSPRASSRVVLTGAQEFMHAAGEARGGGDAGAGMKVATAVHSRLGALVTEQATSLGHTDMASGDTLVINYVPGEEEAEPTDWYLLFRRVSNPQSASSRRPDAIEIPTEFGLAQNHPNPFSSTTTIRFQLPRAEHVTLEIFDAQGRRVSTLADGSYPAGYHAVGWQRATSHGGHVQPGVYVYRIRAGAFHDQKKLVLLP
jgi:hypothetical protein